MKKRYRILLILLFVIIASIIYRLSSAGVFKFIEPHFDGDHVTTYDNAHGTEDIDIDYLNEVLFISSANRRLGLKQIDQSNGISTLDLKHKDAEPVKPFSDFNHGWNPHGISTFVQDSISYLYVINHLADGDFIDLFKYQNDTLFAVSRFSDPLMVSPNDIHGVSTTEFYITNDHSAKDAGQMEDYLQLSNRNVIHYRDGVYSEAAANLAMPNGINASHDGRLLYVSTTIGQEFVTYDRETETGRLREINRQHLGSGLDNIDIDINGDIWIGSHPKLFSFVGHATDKSKLAPSQIFKLSHADEQGAYDVEEVFLSDGSDISASSVGAVYNGDLFIGAVFDKKVYRGRLK